MICNATDRDSVKNFQKLYVRHAVYSNVYEKSMSNAFNSILYWFKPTLNLVVY